MIVVDTNIIAGLYLKNPNLDDIQALLVLEPHWLAPPLWRNEFRNILVQYVRHRQLALVDAIDLMALSEEVVETTDVEISSARILRLAHSSGCSAYDCEYVAMASALSMTLISLDRKILSAFPSLAVTPATFLASSP